MSLSPKLLNRISNIVAQVSGGGGQKLNPTLFINTIKLGNLSNKVNLLKSISLVLMALVVVLVLIVFFMYWQIGDSEQSAISSEELKKLIQAKITQEIESGSFENLKKDAQLTWFVEENESTHSIPSEEMQGRLIYNSQENKLEHLAHRTSTSKQYSKVDKQFSLADLATADNTHYASHDSPSTSGRSPIAEELHLINMGRIGLIHKLNQRGE